MKKAFSLFLVTVFILIHVGVYKYVHYCGTEETSVSYLIKHTNCCCTEEEEESQNDCCNDQLSAFLFHPICTAANQQLQINENIDFVLPFSNLFSFFKPTFSISTENFIDLKEDIPITAKKYLKHSVLLI